MSGPGFSLSQMSSHRMYWLPADFSDKVSSIPEKPFPGRIQLGLDIPRVQPLPRRGAWWGTPLFCAVELIPGAGPALSRS